MNDHYRDVSAAFERITPSGPRPDGWAARARRRSRGRRAAVGMSALAGFALIAAPLAMSLGDLGSPTQTALPADPVTEEPWEPPVECMSPPPSPDEPAEIVPGAVVAGTYCWGDERGSMDYARKLLPEEVDVVVKALGVHESLGYGPKVSFLTGVCSRPAIGHLWLTSASGEGILVQEIADCGLFWRSVDGELLIHPAEPALPDDPYVTAALDGILAFSRVVQVEGRSNCWVRQEPSVNSLMTAVSGYLCDPTGTTVAEIEGRIPFDVVTLIASAAASELQPVGEPSLPTGWSLTLLHEDGGASWLNQLADGTFAYQDPQGGEWQWIPSGEAAAALKELGLEHLR